MNYNKRQIEIGASQLEIREEDNKKFIRGYASLFDNKSLPIWKGRREVVKKGAFSKTIKDGDVRALVNHDRSMVLGRTKAGTLELREDEKGLFVEIDPPNTTYANNLVESIIRGDIDQFSFGFNIIKDKEVMNERDNEIIHEISEVRLFEVSVVTFPAYPDTKAKYRDTEDGKDIVTLENVLESRDINKDYIITENEKVSIRKLSEKINNLVTDKVVEPLEQHSTVVEIEPSDDTQIEARTELVKDLLKKNI